MSTLARARAGIGAYSDIAGELNEIDSKAQCVLIDACYSGTAQDDLNPSPVPRVVLTSVGKTKLE